MASVYPHTPLSGAERARRYQNKIVCKVCVECGTTFEGKRAHQALCSDACRIARRRRLRPQTFKTCAQCGEVFGPVERLVRQYCSAACAYAARCGQPTPKRGRVYPHLRSARIGACLTCGAAFRATSDFAQRRQLYCSHRCYLVNRRVSSFEQRVGLLLEQAGLPLERQKRLKRWVVDFAVPGTMMLVEADGSYWHATPQAQARDERKTQGLKAMGYELHRVDELDFRQRGVAALGCIVQRWESLKAERHERVLAGA